MAKTAPAKRQNAKQKQGGKARKVNTLPPAQGTNASTTKGNTKAQRLDAKGSSTGKKKSSSGDYFQVNTSEQQFILRLPEALAAPLRAATAQEDGLIGGDGVADKRTGAASSSGGDGKGKADPTATIDPSIIEQLTFNVLDNRHVSVHFPPWPKDQAATMVDLPCIIECMKTTDNKQFYKIADISQMLVVGEIPEEVKKRMDDEYTWPDGLTKPLKNVRKRRFQKRASRKLIEDIENEVQRLLAADQKAQHVEYVVQGLTEESMSELATPVPGSLEPSDHEEEEDEEEDEEGAEEEAMESDMENLAAEIELDLLSDDGEDDEDGEEADDDQDDEDGRESHDDMTNDAEEAGEAEDVGMPSSPDEEEKMEQSMDIMHDMEDDNEAEITNPDVDTAEIDMLKEEIEHLKKALTDAAANLAQKRNQLQSTTNPIMKKRVDMMVQSLQEEHDGIKVKLATAKAQLANLGKDA